MKTENSTASVVARRTDDRRRFNMPDECPPNALLAIQQLDTDMWLIRCVKAQKLKPRRIVAGCECDKGVNFGGSVPTCAKCGKPWRFESEQPASDAPAVKVP